MFGTFNVQNARSRVAIVDDDQSVRAAVHNLLSSVGYRTVCFASGEAFLASGAFDDIHCAVFDVRLSGLSGFDLHARLRGAGVHIPVVFVTGYADADMQRRALDAGAVALLRKPIDVDALLGHIAMVLGARPDGGGGDSP